ncbi:hypothetical protein [Alkalimarinus coralli]|uniref:hypothetical protein n=1 Tax=Alkalimarinus coralli TaxID=2935863 RepID=UPI00202B963D|nr:hypothetical protein [Alkalimarinus coralli]
MTYQLKPITAEDQKKILDDFSLDLELKNRFSHAMKEQRFVKFWAVDYESNSYLFLAPNQIRDDKQNCRFCIFVDHEIYSFVLDNMFGPSTISGLEGLNHELLSSLQQKITNAFEVYGRFGEGPLNECGQPEYMFSPEFIEGKG